MNYYFESMYGTIIPYTEISHITSNTFVVIDITTIGGIVIPKFTFKSEEDKNTQISNYKSYINQLHTTKTLM